MTISRWLILGALLGVAGCSSSPTEPDARAGATPTQDDGNKVGIVHPCGQPVGSLYGRVCSGRQ